MPVYYSLYNPPSMPYRGTIPRTAAFPLEQEEIVLGCRVLTAQDAHAALAQLPVGRTPRFSELRTANPTRSSEEYEKMSD
jgi:hypothetical protein